ncbi:MAG: hypothetical protein ACLRSW_16385 [Christensenellaceae bacterium]
MANVSVEVGTEYTLPTPERDGYELAGWYHGRFYRNR